MKILIDLYHPAQVHQFRYIIRELEMKGHRVKVMAVNKEVAFDLLKKFGISYKVIANAATRSILQKAWLLLSITIKFIWYCRKYRPDCFIGRASPMLAMTAAWYGKPHVCFEDTEHSRISLFFCKRLSTVIITPQSFRSNLGKIQKRFPIYKESFYLHPSHFKPDALVLAETGLREGECFILMRFVAWTADHDIGHKGLTNEIKIKATKSFNKFGKVFITSEDELPSELEPYRIKIPPEKIHHLMYFATLLYGESATMASECAMLGTHAIFCDFTGRGYTDEQEKKFDLVYNFKLEASAQEASIEKGISLLKNQNLWKEGKIKREKLLSEIRNGTQLFLDELGKIVTL